MNKPQTKDFLTAICLGNKYKAELKALKVLECREIAEDILTIDRQKFSVWVAQSRYDDHCSLSGIWDHLESSSAFKPYYGLIQKLPPEKFVPVLGESLYGAKHMYMFYINKKTNKVEFDKYPIPAFS